MVGERPHPTHSAPSAARAVLAVLVAAAAGARPLWRRVEADGDSMLPTLRPGDRLLVVTAWRVRPGQLVAVEDPRRRGRLMVKRVRSVQGGTLDVRGDNEEASTDSRHFGLVPRARVLGRVVYRYAPPERAGRPR
jgi:nickel-type superoxide dismutase maturation protease